MCACSLPSARSASVLAFDGNHKNRPAPDVAFKPIDEQAQRPGERNPRDHYVFCWHSDTERRSVTPEARRAESARASADAPRPFRSSP